jgi:hypothetical protein
MKGNNWLHYRILAALKNEIYKNLLTEEHLIPNKIEIKKMNLPDGSSDDTYNFRGWEFVKNNKRYLISDTMNDVKIEIRDILPILPKDELELGSKGNVYLHVKNPTSMRFKAIKSKSFKELLDLISGLKHSNTDMYKLLHMIAFASTFFRTNVRICSNPAFGKDSIIEIYNALIDRCGTITSPTLAKLEERSVYLRWLGISEVVDIGSTEWRIIQQYLLDAGAHKQSVTKHSRAYGGVGESLDLSKLSISLLYNDIIDYNDPEEYFDNITKAAVKDRFPAFRFHGQYLEDFNQLTEIDIPKYVKDNLDSFKDIIYNYMYYMKNHKEYLHNYTNDIIKMYNTRGITNLSNICKIIDMYSSNQEEFNHFTTLLNNCMHDYNEMLNYPKLLIPFYKRLGVSTDKVLPLSQVYMQLLNKPSTNKSTLQYIKEIIIAETFIEKNKLIKEFKESKVTKDEIVWV